MLVLLQHEVLYCTNAGKVQGYVQLLFDQNEKQCGFHNFDETSGFTE